MALITDRKVVVLVGGVGGAKLALGLQSVVAPQNLTVIVNTGDDFWHYGLRICPDLDTVLYTLSGRVDPVNGWGVQDDSVIAMKTLSDLGEDVWFRLGDKDLATHLFRTERLRRGQSLTTVIAALARAQGIEATILPMTDHEVATIVDTVERGELAFQEYFVKHRWQPTVRTLHYAGADDARPTDAVRQAINEADVILIGPSNPWLSIAPILALPDMRANLLARPVPRAAVTPIVEGRALKGPAAKLMLELGYETVSAAGVAAYYGDVINAFAYDGRDKSFQSHEKLIKNFDTIMKTKDDKVRLARELLVWLSEMELV